MANTPQTEIKNADIEYDFSIPQLKMITEYNGAARQIWINIYNENDKNKLLISDNYTTGSQTLMNSADLNLNLALKVVEANHRFRVDKEKLKIEKERNELFKEMIEVFKFMPAATMQGSEVNRANQTFNASAAHINSMDADPDKLD